MNKKEVSNGENKNIAGKYYDPDYYTSNDETEKGMAITHEQTSDTWTEGTIDAVIDDVDGNDLEIPRKGYDTKG